MSANKVDIMVVSFTGDTGLTDYSASLCRELSKLAAVELVTAKSFDEHKYQATYPIKKLFRRTRQFPVDVFKFIAHVLRTRPKVVLFQSWLKSPALELPLVVVFRALGIRVILTVHDLLPHYPKPWSKLECALYYRAFNRLIVHSQKQLDGLHAMGVHRNTLVVPHGIYDIFNTLNLSRSDAIASFPTLAVDDFVVLFFGHLDERKGVVDFVAAAAQMKKEHSDLRFVIAGKPDGRSNTAKALATGKLLPNMLIHDYLIAHEDVQRYFAACDAVALPYREGTTSGVVKLAMAFKKPVICTDVGDFSESIAMWSGLLIDGDNLPTSLVQGVRKMRSEQAFYSDRTHLQAQDIEWKSIAKKYAAHAFGPLSIRDGG
jgi:glycosyltransferase involved in cell wall biosynthesis